MARPIIPPGSRGEITYTPTAEGVTASCYVRDLDGTRHRVKASAADEQSARDALVARIALRSAGLGRGTVTATMPLANLALVWLVSLRGKSEATVAAYTRAVQLHIVPALGDIPLREVTPDRLGSFLVNFAAESAAAARLARVVLRGMFALAVSSGALASSPVPADPDPSSYKPAAARQLSRIDFRRLRAAVSAWLAEPTAGPPRGQDLLDQVDLLLGSGCRRVGEMLAARWSDFDLDRGTWTVSGVVDRSSARGLHVRLYDGELQTLELPAFVVAMLRRRGPKPGGLLFSSRAGGPVDPANFRRALLTAAPDFSWVKPGSLVQRDVLV